MPWSLSGVTSEAEPHDDARTANMPGALVLGLVDEIRAAATRQATRSGETPAALVALGHQPGLSNDGLSRVLGLSHAGAVRLVDRLAADGLVERRPAWRAAGRSWRDGGRRWTQSYRA